MINLVQTTYYSIIIILVLVKQLNVQRHANSHHINHFSELSGAEQSYGTKRYFWSLVYIYPRCMRPSWQLRCPQFQNWENWEPIKNEQDQQLFQDDIHQVESWCQQYKLYLNTDKCNILHFSRANNPFSMLCVLYSGWCHHYSSKYTKRSGNHC